LAAMQRARLGRRMPWPVRPLVLTAVLLIPVLWLLSSSPGHGAPQGATGGGGGGEAAEEDDSEYAPPDDSVAPDPPPRAKHALFDEHLPIVEMDASKPPYRFAFQHCPKVNPKKPGIFQGVHGTVAGAMNAGFVYSNSTHNAQLIVACYRKMLPSLKVDHGRHKLVSNIIGVVQDYCLGATKLEQLACRRDLAAMHGCKYADINLQPVQFSLPEDCAQLEAMPVDKPFLIKPIASNNGRGIRYLASRPAQAECRKEFGRGFVAQLYINSPLLQGRKFDVRTFMLVARLDPLIIFQAPGYVSVSSTVYDPASTDPLVHITNVKGQEDDPTHYRTFEAVQSELHAQYRFPEDYMTGSFLKQTARGSVFAAMAQFKTQRGGFATKPRLGYFHLFAADWVVDRNGRVHLLEFNGYPWQGNLALRHTGERAEKMWHDMMAVVLDVNVDPGHLFGQSAWGDDELVRKGVWHDGAAQHGASSLSRGFTFGHWTLIYSELETPMSKYDACDLPEVEVVD